MAKSSVLGIGLGEAVLKMICELIGVHSRPQVRLLRIGPNFRRILVISLISPFCGISETREKITEVLPGGKH